MKISLFKIIISYIFIMPLLALGKSHVFSEDHMISELDISCFSDDCIFDCGSKPTMSFSDDGKHFAAWDDEYIGIYELNAKDVKPTQKLRLTKKHPWGNVYRGKVGRATFNDTGNIIFDGTARKYIPLLYSSCLFPKNFQTLKSYVIENEKLMGKYNFLLHEKAFRLEILGGYKSSSEAKAFLLGSKNYKSMTCLGQTNFSLKDSEYGLPSISMLSSDMTRACIPFSVPEEIFSFYYGEQKVFNVTLKDLQLKNGRTGFWSTSTSSLSDDGKLLAVIFMYGGRKSYPWNIKTAIAFIDTEEKKIKNIKILRGARSVTFCFSNDKSRVAVWEYGEKVIRIYHLKY